MTPDPKRETYLPHQLNGLWSKQNSIQGESASSETKVQGKNHAYRLGIPIKSSKLERKLDNPKQTSQAKYHKSYNIDQAGPGVIALKDTEKLPICLLKYSQSQKERSCLKLQFASHKNLVSLIDHFQSGDEVHLVYEYEHLAVTLGCVAGTVSFSEADIATICKEVLEGLKYVHTILRITYGMLDFSNILLTWQGEVKLANIGESLLSDHRLSRASKDIEDIGRVVVFLSDRSAPLGEPNQDTNNPSLSQLAYSFVQRTKESTTIECLIEDEFLHLANPGGSWSLKRHYFETLPLGIRIGSRANR